MVPELAPDPFEPDSLLGEILDGRYRMTSHLATGGMGAVFRAEHVYMRKEVALKVLRPDLTTSSDIVERFRREAEIAASLEHENIVRVTDFGRDPAGYLFLAMELLEGESLFEKLRREGPLPAEEAIPILVQVCAGLEAAHLRGVVHRDLKPENIFLSIDPRGRVVAKILDFGIAKIADPGTSNATQAGMVVGTPEYLSPEQALGAAVDGRADLYAVGLIAWRMLAGRHPFRWEDARSLLMMQATQPIPPLTDPRPDLVAYPALLAAVARACAKTVSERQRSAAELRAELAGCLGPAGELPVHPLDTMFTPPPARAPSGFDLQAPAFPEAQVAFSTAAMTRAGRASLGFRLRALLGLARRITWPKLVRRVRERPLAAAAWIGVSAIILALLASVAVHRDERVARGRMLLGRGRPEEALPLLEKAVAAAPRDAESRLLLGHALHRIPGQTSAALDQYEEAFERGGRELDPAALDDLASDLSRERRVADRAARLLGKVGRPASAAVAVAAAAQGPGAGRLRALDLLRDVGAEDRVDRLEIYSVLLGDPECDVRRSAAKRLGDIGEKAALPRLKELAQGRKETRGLFGTVQRTPVCGATEATAAVRRILAARR